VFWADLDLARRVPCAPCLAFPLVGAVVAVLVAAVPTPDLKGIVVRIRLVHPGEPTAAELAAIEAERPLIDAELAWLDAEITLLSADDRGGPSALDWHRVRRAESRVIGETLAYVGRRRATRPLPRRAA